MQTRSALRRLLNRHWQLNNHTISWYKACPSHVRLVLEKLEPVNCPLSQGPKTHLVVPCGHVALCGGCAALIGKSLTACPVSNPTHLNPQPSTMSTRARPKESSGKSTL